MICHEICLKKVDIDRGEFRAWVDNPSHDEREGNVALA